MIIGLGLIVRRISIQMSYAHTLSLADDPSDCDAADNSNTKNGRARSNSDFSFSFNIFFSSIFLISFNYSLVVYKYLLFK